MHILLVTNHIILDLQVYFFLPEKNDILVFILIQLLYSTMCLKTGKSSCLHYGILLPHINLYHRSKKLNKTFFSSINRNHRRHLIVFNYLFLNNNPFRLKNNPNI